MKRKSDTDEDNDQRPNKIQELPRLVHAPAPSLPAPPLPVQVVKTEPLPILSIIQTPEIVMRETLPLEEAKKSLTILPDRISKMIAVLETVMNTLKYTYALSQLANAEATAVNYSGNANFKLMTALNEIAQNIGSVNTAVSDDHFRDSLAGLFGIATSANCVRFNIHKSAAQYFKTYNPKN